MPGKHKSANALYLPWIRAYADSIESKRSPRVESDKQGPSDSLVRYLQLVEHVRPKAARAMKAAVADFPTLVSAAKGVLMSKDQHRAKFSS
ncbi:MAG: hypothetical protein FRX49_12446 [Trebouxia sp. A1-2]|nr:MAG: hypothetical protein FRX49_12446 [Trebouxia sp. A1-2]